MGLGTTLAAAHAADAPVALIIAQGGLGDQSYNDLAFAGFKRALAATKLDGKPVESKDVVAQAEDMLRRAADAGFGLIVDLEYSHGETLAKVAAAYPDAKFVILNQVQPGKNVASVLFQEQEGSYLAGALAAMVTSDTSIKGINDKPIIGVIGGTKSVGIDKFIVGYIQGARDVNPKIDVKVGQHRGRFIENRRARREREGAALADLAVMRRCGGGAQMPLSDTPADRATAIAAFSARRRSMMPPSLTGSLARMRFLSRSTPAPA